LVFATAFVFFLFFFWLGFLDSNLSRGLFFFLGGLVQDFGLLILIKKALSWGLNRFLFFLFPFLNILVFGFLNLLLLSLFLLLNGFFFYFSCLDRLFLVNSLSCSLFWFAFFLCFFNFSFRFRFTSNCGFLDLRSNLSFFCFFFLNWGCICFPSFLILFFLLGQNS